MRSNRLALMGTTLAAVLLGACSQAADMPTEVAMPDVVASANSVQSFPVVSKTVEDRTGEYPLCDNSTMLQLKYTYTETRRRGPDGETYISRTYSNGTATDPSKPGIVYTYLQWSSSTASGPLPSPKHGWKVGKEWRLYNRDKTQIVGEGLNLRGEIRETQVYVFNGKSWVEVGTETEQKNSCEG